MLKTNSKRRKMNKIESRKIYDKHLKPFVLETIFTKIVSQIGTQIITIKGYKSTNQQGKKIASDE